MERLAFASWPSVGQRASRADERDERRAGFLSDPVPLADDKYVRMLRFLFYGRSGLIVGEGARIS